MIKSLRLCVLTRNLRFYFKYQYIAIVKIQKGDHWSIGTMVWSDCYKSTF